MEKSPISLVNVPVFKGHCISCQNFPPILSCWIIMCIHYIYTYSMCSIYLCYMYSWPLNKTRVRDTNPPCSQISMYNFWPLQIYKFILYICYMYVLYIFNLYIYSNLIYIFTCELNIIYNLCIYLYIFNSNKELNYTWCFMMALLLIWQDVVNIFHVTLPPSL